MSKFSDFIRNATPEQKEKVMQRVMEISEYEQEIVLLRSQVTAANARERKSFMAGFAYGIDYDIGNPDSEQCWQQYRCQDDTDWKAVSEDDAAKIDAAVLAAQCQHEFWDKGQHTKYCIHCGESGG